VLSVNSEVCGVLESQDRDVCRSVCLSFGVMSLGVKTLISKNRYVMIEPLLSNDEGQISASAHDGCRVSSSERSRYVMELFSLTKQHQKTWRERSRFCSFTL
jgi:hypothetical protein